MMHLDQICTPFELKLFAFAEHNPTAFNFARFIESKSGFKYTVINTEFLLDAFRLLAEQIQFATNLESTFKHKWHDLLVLDLLDKT